MCVHFIYRSIAEVETPLQKRRESKENLYVINSENTCSYVKCLNIYRIVVTPTKLQEKKKIVLQLGTIAYQIALLIVLNLCSPSLTYQATHALIMRQDLLKR